MAKRNDNDGLSISELQRMLSARQAELKKLSRQRAALQARVDQIDAQIARLGGEPAGGGRRGGRARNELSLSAAIEQVLKQAGEPMKVGPIADAVQGAGYRSNSANFRGIVNQTLIKDKRFGSAGRGLYQLKK
jgi:hypothetical protein